MAENKTESGTPAPAPAAPTSGGFAAWLPLIVTLVAMPALAYATTTFLILPKMKAKEAPAEETAEAPAEGGHGEASHGSAEKPAGGKKAKVSVSLNKMVVNVAGTMGTRYLMTSVTVAGTVPNFKERIEENRDQLLDLATSTLSSKTISDLEKPGARNQIKTELMSVFNNALGDSLVKEIWIPEMAIQ